MMRLLIRYLMSAVVWATIMPLVELASQPPSGNSEVNQQSPLHFRREYVPEAFYKDVIKQLNEETGDAYIPMDRDEFEKTIQRLSASAGQQERGVYIERAVYSARLEGQRLVDGGATWWVGADNATRRFLPLYPLNLPINQPEWLGVGTPPAQLGLDLQGRTGLMVERSGQLRFSWTLQGRSLTGARHLSFDLHLPPCALNQLYLELPLDRTPRLGKGTVSRVSAPADLGEVGRETQLWLLEFGSSSPETLSILSKTQTQPGIAVSHVQQTNEHAISLSGNHLKSQIQFTLNPHLADQIVFDISPGVDLVSVRLGSQSVVAKQIEATSQRNRYAIDLADTQVSGAQVLTIEGLAPIVLRQWLTLPKIEMAQANWQEASSTLLLAPEINLIDLELTGGLLSKVPAKGPRSAQQRLEVVHDDPSATVRLKVAASTDRLQGVMCTSVQASTDTVTATFRALLHTQQKDCFRINGNILGRWRIDTVQVTRSLSADARDLVDRWQQKTRMGETDLVAIHLEQAIQADQPVYLTIKARWLPRFPGDQLTMNQLALVQLLLTESQRHTLALKAEPPNRFHLDGTWGVEQLNPESLTETEKSLCDVTNPEMIVAVDWANREFVAQVRQERKINYDADITLQARIADYMINERYTIVCKSTEAKIDRLIVRFSQPRSEALSWSIESSEPATLQAKQDDAGSQQVPFGSPDSHETWVVDIRPPLAGPFTIRAERTSRRQDRDQLSLASLVQATSQVGRLVVEQLGRQQVDVRVDGLDVLPFHAFDAHQYGRVQGVYRYHPNDIQPVTVQRVDLPPQRHSWAWLRETSSFVSNDSSYHQVTFRLYNEGRRQLRVDVPHRYAVRQVLVDGVSTFARPDGQKDQSYQLNLTLPLDKKYLTVTVVTQSVDRLPWATGLLHGPSIELDVPILRSTWRIWVPSEYASWPASGRSEAWGSQPWWNRLLGPLLPRDRAPHLLPHQRAATPQRLPAWYQRWQQQVAAEWEPELVENRWSFLLRQVAEKIDSGQQTPPVMMIDAMALSGNGIQPSARISAVHGTFPADLSAALQQWNLVLVVRPDAVVVTTYQRAKQWEAAGWVKSIDSLTAVANGRLAELNLAELSTLWSWTNVHRWHESTTPPTDPWQQRLVAFPKQDVMVGWTLVQLDQPHGEAVSVRIVSVGMLRIAQWMVVLVTAGLVLGLFSFRRRWAITAILAACVLALVAPAWTIPFFSATCVGAALACLIRSASLLWRREPQQGHSTESSTGSTNRRSSFVAGAVVLLLIVAWQASTYAYQTENSKVDDPKIKPKKYFSVVIPTDENYQPTGGLVYVPLEFYDALNHLDQRAEGIEGVLLESAKYHVSLRWEEVKTRLGVDEMTATWQFSTFQPNTRVQIPVHQGQAILLSDPATLNDQPVSIQVTDQGLSVVANEAGRHELKVAFRPVVRQEDGRHLIEIQLPGLLQAQLEVKAPDDAPPLTFPGAIGTIKVDEEENRYEVDLGPSPRLEMTWPKTDQPVTAQAPRAELLQWIKSESGSYKVRARLYVDATGDAALKRLHLSTDSHWRVQLLNHSQVTVLEPPNSSGRNHLFFELAQDANGLVVIDWIMEVTETSGVGQFAVPRWRLENGLDLDSWVAVEFPDTVVLTETSTDLQQSISIDRFIQKWTGQSSVDSEVFRPVVAYRHVPEITRPFIRLAMKRARVTAEQQLNAVYRPETVHLDLQANLEVENGSVSALRCELPAEINVQSVSVVQAGIEQVAHWSLDENNHLTIFLRLPVTNQLELKVQGAQPYPTLRWRSFPRISLKGVDIKQTRLRVFRQEGTRMQLLGLPSSEDLSAEQPFVAGRGRLVANWVEAAGDPPASVQVQVSKTSHWRDGAIATVMQSTSDGWVADLYIHLKLGPNSVPVDLLRFEYSDQWGGPFEIKDLDATIHVLDDPGRASHQLLIRPATPIADEVVFRVRGFVRGQPTRVPRIRPLGLIPDRQHFVVLPRRTGAEVLDWSKSGLARANLRSPLPAAIESLDDAEVYRLDAADFRAVVENVRPSRIPQVRLIDVHLVCHSDRQISGIAAIDLEPAQSEFCDIEMPEGYRLQNVTIGGVPTQVSAVSPNLWRLMLGPRNLPQRIVITFSGVAEVNQRSGAETYVLRAPRLREIPVERTLWSVARVDRSSRGVTVEYRETVDALKQEFFRMRTLAELLFLSATSAAEYPAVDRENWYRLWSQRFAASHAMLAAGATSGRDDDPLAPDQLTTFVQQQRDLAVRLELEDAFEQAMGQTVRSADQILAWKTALGRELETVHFVSTGEATRVKVRYPHPRQDREAPYRWGLALLLVLGSFWGLRLGIHHSLRQAVATMVLWVPGMIGLIWVFWLTPPWLGWLFLLASFLGLIVTYWPSGRRTTDR